MPDDEQPTDAFDIAVGLTFFLRHNGIPVHEVTGSEPGRFAVWVESDDPRHVEALIQLLPQIPQILAYRYHPTSRAVLELYSLGAVLSEPPPHGLHYIQKQKPAEHRDVLDLDQDSDIATRKPGES